MTNTPKIGITLLAQTDPMPAVQWASQFSVIDGAIGFKICTSSTRPASPYPGMLIFETDTLRHLMWYPLGGYWWNIDAVGLGFISGANGSGNVSGTTETMVLTKSIPTWYNRRFRIHADGMVNYSLDSQTTSKCEVKLRANLNGTTVAITDSLVGGVYADAMEQGVPFSVDGVFTASTNSTNMAVGLSVTFTGLGVATNQVINVSRLDIYDLGTGL